MLERTPMSVADFDAFVKRPENADKLFEFIAGETFEVPSNAFSSKLSIIIAVLLYHFVFEKNLGHVTGEQGGYMVNGERYAPDVAFISYERQPQLAKKGYNPNPPELAVEIISEPGSAEEQNRLRRKLSNYLAAGTLVWIIDPKERLIEVHSPTKGAKILDEAGVLDGGEVLPGFSLSVKTLFDRLATGAD